MNPQLVDEIIDLINKEVIPATGCTEPVAVALATAHAMNTFKQFVKIDKIESVEVALSANMLKNAMGVGIPGTNMIGLPIAIALGIVIARPEKQLTILDNFSTQDLETAKAFVEKNIIHISQKKEDVDKLYIEIEILANGHKSKAIIEKIHTNLTQLTLDGQPVHNGFNTCQAGMFSDQEQTDELQLNFDMVYQFALEAPIEKIRFILEAGKVNKAASEFSLKGNYGHAVGRMIRSERGKKYLGDSHLISMLSMTSSACDARMDGAPVTVMSNSGSGNQGITATLPVVSFAEREGSTEAQKIRALALSSLMVIYIKQKLGRLSALCGCVVASIGSSCGITYLMGGSKQQIGYSIKNMIGNITGMLCDGAKPSCSMKVSSGVSSAMISSLLAMEEKCVSSKEGIVDEDIDKSVENLTSIGKNGMEETDSLVLHIMTHKK